LLWLTAIPTIPARRGAPVLFLTAAWRTSWDVAGSSATRASRGQGIATLNKPSASRTSRSCQALREDRAALWRCALALALWLLAPWIARASVDLPIPDPLLPLTISADRASHWRLGEYDVYTLDACRIEQHDSSAQADRAVIWVLREPDGAAVHTRAITYLEGAVRGTFVGEDGRRATIDDATWLGEFDTVSAFRLKTPPPTEDPLPRPEVFHRASRARDPKQRGLQETQQIAPPAISPLPAPPMVAPGPRVEQPDAVLNSLPAGTRRVLVLPRSSVEPQIQWFPSADQSEWVATIDSGINIIVQGVGSLGALDIAADRAVIWMRNERQPNSQTPDIRAGTLQPLDQPLELYLEGNIVFREGERTIHADRMYYNVRNENGIVLNSELRTEAPLIGQPFRLRSQLVQITGRDRFLLRDSFATSSQLGAPRYRIQSGEIEFTDSQFPLIDPATGLPAVNAEGEPLVDHRQSISSRNNLVYMGAVPVFYWPVFAADLSDPSFFLKRIQLRNDRIFGTQVLTSFGVWELLGIRNKPQGTDWRVHADYLSERGLGHGTTFTYTRPNFLGLGGPTSGLLDAWAINDTGVGDTLGSDRKDVPFPKNYRWRVLNRHRQLLPNNFILSGEFGWISDRNFLEQYYEREWDEFKDESTTLELRRLVNNRSWSLRTQSRLNNFFSETQQARFDHFWLGQSFLNDSLTFYEHTALGYSQFRMAAFPDNPIDAAKFVWFPWEQNRSGERLVTRNEVDLPFDLGPAKVVPYALGELARWGQDLSGDPLNRLYGQAGVRTSIPFWAANPSVESSLFNVHGLAHKVTLEADAAFSGANQSMTDLPLYDQIDDNNLEQYRRRFTFNTFGGPLPDGNVPTQFDPRFYALRYGIQDSVTSPVAEIAEDFATLKLNLFQRLQTKRGLPGQRRIIDWMTFNTGVTYFPAKNRDNFGQSFGLLNYDYNWYIGDRTTIVSDGVFDFFHDGQKIWTVGGYLNRPPRGSLFVGFRWLEGPDLANVETPFRNQVLIANYTYQLSPKWLSSFGTSFDIGGNGNIGQNFTIARLGESFIVSAGFNVDASKGNVGATFMVEPRFLPGGRLRGYSNPADTVGLQ